MLTKGPEKTPTDSDVKRDQNPPEEAPGALAVHLGRAIASAAAEGRLDVVNELAVLLVRLGAEERQRVNREAGVIALDERKGR